MSNESDEQKKVVEWFRLQYPVYYLRLFSIGNGSWFNGTGVMKFKLVNKYKSMGLLNGVSDLFLAVPSRLYSGMFIEMKVLSKKRKYLTTAQQLFIDEMNHAGYFAVCTKGFNEAKKAVEWYLDENDTSSYFQANKD